MKITLEMTLFELVSNYPESKSILEANGFDVSDKLIATVGKNIKLETALQSRKINKDLFIQQLNEAVNEATVDSTLNERKKLDDSKISVKGVLPCPVRLPLLESFEAWLESSKRSRDSLNYELLAASMGVEWLKEELANAKSQDDLSDLFLSAGFDIFFDENLLDKFKKQHVFEDYSDIGEYNSDFNNDEIQLKDPKNEYAMIAVVPAVFLVNRKELGDREVPRSWADLFKPEFRNAVSLPVGDFDLFNAILLNIHKLYGEEGVRKLKESFLVNMHPSEMVKSHITLTKPVVTIMPYFFTKMAKENGPMIPVWPEDGAIISPIFMLAKKDKKEELKPYVDFYSSKETGEILSHNGRFPSINPEVDNLDAKGKKYMWLGWDYIENNDIAELIELTTGIFEGERQ